MPISAVGMIAAHLYLERIKTDRMLPRDLDRLHYGRTVNLANAGGATRTATYRETFALDSAMEAWIIAQAVEDAEPSRSEQGRPNPNT